MMIFFKLFQPVTWMLIEIVNKMNTFHICFTHLSQRLIGELIGYPWSIIRPSVRRRPFTMLKDILQNRLANQSQILCGASLGRGKMFCSQHLGHMTKMTATPIYGKNPPKIFFSRTCRLIFTKLGS